ncbi:MFS transporter [Sulfitobacter donghicola]|uniref:MFS transporter n=1 Tax=Sulfitobacter donghicola DSW-25 = KCTC 12864 = JCM 14565 TaxID=1300350 RepID=A0A073ILY4_9RHOB|nr:MFS transporter [Sulfitobacter donghicola]KEJ90501.1 MFS transporter [Sulfitobacter donghicola DSW-25 = KCTC 12864 = JCM 14565]KIN67743.1 Major facilitator superfamily (MFS) transporter [Sulfitobacter donghicola DSW-25 = KCTC 12864 = JCM 14565]
MAVVSQRKRIWGWYFFDWASQPYNTLILTFIFGPYFTGTLSANLIADGMADEAARAQAQAYWGWGLAATGILIAILAPVLGAIADNSGRKMPWIWLFSAMYFVGSGALWWSAPQDFSVLWTLFFFGMGLIGMEFATIFTNSYLPELSDDPAELGRISGSGWAFGYVGGLIALVIMLLLFQATANGTTMIGLQPLFGMDTETKADTRIVGPLTAIWFAVFMIPFFLYTRDTRTTGADPLVIGDSLKSLLRTLKGLPNHPSLLAYLGSSMFYRDGLNGLYTFGGIYAFGVLGWTVTQVGIFGIVAIISGAVFCWISGRVDRAIGPMPVIAFCVLTLAFVSLLIVTITPESILFIPIAQGSNLPDVTFFITGAIIGAAGGALQASSRNMMTRQANPDRMTEAFGLYALSGKATSFLAPALIAFASQITGSQRLGVSPVVGLFIIGLILLFWVKPKGDFRK